MQPIYKKKLLLTTICGISIPLISMAGNNAINFGGSNKITVSNFSTPSNGFSIECDVKLNALLASGTPDIISTHENSSGRKGYFIELGFNGSGQPFTIKGGIANHSNSWVIASSNVNWAINEWHHLAMVYEKSTKNVKLYIDGTLSSTTSFGTDSALYSTRPFDIGGSDYYSGNGFNGAIDEVYFWNKELSANEVDSAAHKNKLSNSTNLYAYYNLDTITGSNVSNSATATINTLTGTINNLTGISLISSNAPLTFNPLTGFGPYKANWNGNNTSDVNGLKIYTNYADETYFTVQASNNQSGVVYNNLPTNIISRLAKVWKMEKHGSTTSMDSLRFSMYENNIQSNYGNIFLLKSNDGNAFSYVDSLVGTVNNGNAIFKMADTMSQYFTLGFTDSVNNTTETFTVASGTDDAEEHLSDGSIDLTSSDLEMMLDGTITQQNGIRFTNLNIPPNSTIQHAYIQFTNKGDKNPVLGDVYIHTEDTANTATFTSTTHNITSRHKSIDSVLWAGSTDASWNNGAGGTAGAAQRTPDLKDILQSLVNRADWVSGNAGTFIFSGAGVRNTYSYNGAQSAGHSEYIAKLIVSYLPAQNNQMEVINFPIPTGAEWKYRDDGVDLGTTWHDSTYDDNSWAYGNAKLGYGDNNEVTTLTYGGNSSAKYPTYYFRKQFYLDDSAQVGPYATLKLLRDDGAVVYVNGQEVVRSNMPTGTISYSTWASTAIDGAAEDAYNSFSVPYSYFKTGLNTIAVEIHQANATSSDIGFNLSLDGYQPASLLRGPYLNAATTNSIVVRWRTDAPEKSIVHIGTSASNLNQVFADSTDTTEHIVKITGLSPSAKYYYNIGSNYHILQGSDSNYFSTLIPAGVTDSLIRIGVIGDCGNNSTNQRNVRDQLYNYIGNKYMNAWILLGDNAYTTGSDDEFQAEFFNIYKDNFLKQNPLFPTPGNHDYQNNHTSSWVMNHQDAAYYKNFTIPTSGEAGGLPSNNPSYYSFNIGNIHFISLDSYGRDADSSRLYDTAGPQVTWLKQDLAANTNKGWVVCYWHHPPYTMGSHNSDRVLSTDGSYVEDADLTLIRQNFIQILERLGVDLILCGHSHDYERTRLIKGYYGFNSDYSTSYEVSHSSALYDGTTSSCPYEKDSVTNYQGTVYVVSGSAGQLGGSQSTYPHNAMYYANKDIGGAMMLEVKGNRLDAKWVNSDGQIRDKFTMMKDASVNKSYTIQQGDPITLKAAYVGAYNWVNDSTNNTTNTYTVAPQDTTVYVVKDSFSCITDTFQVNVLSADVVLPLTWNYIKADIYNYQANIVNWSTLKEENTQSFEIQRADKNGIYQTIGMQKAAGNSINRIDYQFIDTNIDATQSLFLYRLKLNDLDGNHSYSKIVSVNRANIIATQLQLYPNPAAPSKMKIGINKSVAQNAIVSVTDVSGRIVYQKVLSLSNQAQTFLPTLQDGVYFLSVKTDNQLFTKKIVLTNNN